MPFSAYDKQKSLACLVQPATFALLKLQVSEDIITHVAKARFLLILVTKLIRKLNKLSELPEKF